MSVLPYLLVFFSDTELLFDSEFWLKPKYRYCYNHRHPQAVVNVEFAKCKHRGFMHFFISLQKCKIINPRLLIKSAVVKFIGFVYHL